MTVSLGIILPLYTRSFQSMPASTPPSLNHNSYNTRTGHSNRCVFVGITDAEKEAMSVNVASVMKLFFSLENTHIYTHCGLMCCHRFSFSIVMSREGFRSATIFMSILYKSISLQSSWGLCPLEVEVGLKYAPLIFVSFLVFSEIQCVQISFSVKDWNESRDDHHASNSANILMFFPTCH